MSAFSRLIKPIQQKIAELPDIILHLGAHKTATTTVQKTLMRSCATLASNGILVPKTNILRDSISKNLKQARFHRAQQWPLQRLLAVDHSATEIDTAKRIVLSDENLLGYVDHIFEKGRFYSDAKPRCALLSNWLPQPPKQILFAIRPYTGFFKSAYGQWIGLDNEFISREMAQQTALMNKRGWADVVADIQSQFPQSEIIVSRYQRNEKFTARQLEFLTTMRITDLDHDKKLFWNKGLSADKLLELESGLAAGNMQPERIKELRDQKIWGWPRNNAEFWSPDDTKILHEKFVRDIAKIAAMPDVQSHL